MIVLIKHRPSIELRAPSRIVPGQEATCRVLVTTKRELPIAAITAEIRGEERANAGGENGTVHRIQWVNLRAELSGPRMLSEGENELSFRFELPENAPASFGFGSVAVEYLAKIHVDIDWWPDQTSLFILNVGSASEAEPAVPSPRVYSTAPLGPVGSDASLELSLSSDVVAKDGNIEFSVGAVNTEKKTVRKLTATLVPQQTILSEAGRVTSVRNLPGYVVRLTPVNLTDGSVLRMKVPEVPATTRSRLFQLDYSLDLQCDFTYWPDQSIKAPIEIREAGGVMDNQNSRPAPVGESREREFWASLGAELNLEVDGFRLHGQLKDVGIEVRLGRRDEEARLVAELTFPSLHLGLDGGPRAGLRRLFRKYSPVGTEAFLETHCVTGRDETQLVAWTARLNEHLLTKSLGELSDERITLVSRHRTQVTLRDLCNLALNLAFKLPDARNAIPAPLAGRAFHDTWEECGQRENAQLENARMALHFDLGESQGAVITKWDSEGKPSRTTIRLKVQNPIGEDYRFETWGEDPLDLDGFGKQQRDSVMQIRTHASYFSITTQEIQVYLPPMLEDPEPGVAMLRRLMSLHGLLRGATGPYR